MATYTKRKNSWRVQIYVKGIRESATFDTKAEARAWASERETELRNGMRGVLPDYTLKQAIERYISDVATKRKGYKWERDRLNKFMRDNPHLILKPIKMVTTDDLVKWRDDRERSVKAASVRREGNLLSGVFSIARKEWKWVKDNPMADLKLPTKPKPRDRRISDDEIERLCLSASYEPYTMPTTATQQIMACFLLAIETGMRQGELLKIRWQDVHIKERYIQLYDTKNSDDRHVPLSSNAIRLIESLKGVDDSKLFTVNSGSFSQLFRKLRNRCEIEDLHFHDTRHEACTRLARKIPMEDLARMLGHRRLDSVMIYYNATATEIASLLD